MDVDPYEEDSEDKPIVEVRGSFTLECQQCRTKYVFSDDQMDVDFEVIAVDEREMGPETAYEWTEYPSCPNCGTVHTITCRVWEYPVGAYNMHEFEVKGVNIDEEKTPIIIVNAVW